jgi:heme exporter protein D
VGYVIAAYAISIGAVAAYGIHLARERRALMGDLAQGRDSPPTAEPAGAGAARNGLPR